MDAKDFDALTRSAHLVSRRRLLGLLAGGATAGVVSGLVPGIGRPAAARAATGAAAAEPLTCRDDNFVQGACDQFSEYETRCGTLCPDGWEGFAREPGQLGCTLVITNLPISAPSHGPVQVYEDPFDPFGGGVCASFVANWDLQILAMRTETLAYEVTGHVADQNGCRAEVERHMHAALDHEQQHKNQAVNVIDRTRAMWTNLEFTACDSQRGLAIREANRRFARAEADTRALIDAEIRRHEVPVLTWNCGACEPRSACGCTLESTCCSNNLFDCCPPGQWCTGSPDPNQQTPCCPNDRGVVCEPWNGGGCCPTWAPVCCIGPLGAGCCTPSFPICSQLNGRPTCARPRAGARDEAGGTDRSTAADTAPAVRQVAAPTRRAGRGAS